MKDNLGLDVEESRIYISVEAAHTVILAPASLFSALVNLR